MTYKEHFKVKQLSLCHQAPKLFITSQWQFNKSDPSVFYLVYRIILAAFLISTWVISFTAFNWDILGHSWAVFLTNWGYTLCVLQAFVSFLMLFYAMMVMRVLKKPHLMEYILKLQPFYWLINIVATPVGFLITIIFWAALWQAGMEFTAMNFFVHGSNSIVLMLDLWLISHPVRILHALYPFLLGLIYCIFSVIYNFYDKNRGGTGIIYPILDWDDPLVAILVSLGSLVLLIFLHLIIFGIYKLRSMLYKRIYLDNTGPSSNGTQSTEQLEDAYM